MAETSQKAMQRSQTVLKSVKNKSKSQNKSKRLKRSTKEKAKKTSNGEKIELTGTAQSIDQSSQEMVEGSEAISQSPREEIVEGSEATSQSPHKESRLPDKDENSSSTSQPLKDQHSSENESQCSHETVEDSRDKDHSRDKQGRFPDKGERPPLRYSYIKSSDNAYQSLKKKKELLDKCQTSSGRNIKLNWKSPRTRVETYHFCGICKSIFNDKRSFEEHAKTAHISTQNEELKNQKPGNSTGSEGSENQQTRDTFEISQDEKFLEAGQGPLVLLCAICNSVFTTIRLLKEHTEKMHGGAKISQDTNQHVIKDVEDTSSSTGSKKKCESIQGVSKQPGRSSDEDVVPPCLDKESAKRLLASKGYAKVMQNKELILEEIRRDGRVMGYTYSYKPKPKKRAEKYKGILSGNTCLICQKEFKKKKNAYGHAQLIHFAVKKFFCTYCNKGFKRSNHLKNHLVTHTGAKPYSCFYCEASFGRQDKLKLHLRMHTGERPYRCEICSKTFRKWEHLNQHLLVHQQKVSDQDGVRYKCKICSQENSTVNEFLKHVNIHKDGNSAFCSFCDESFKSMYERRQHNCKNAVPSVVYLCPICKVVFRTKNLVEEHAKKEHSQGEKDGTSVDQESSNSGIKKSKSSGKAKRPRANKNKGQSDSVNEMYSDGTDEGNQETLSYLENVIASDVLQHISNMHFLSNIAAEQQAQHLPTQFLQYSSLKGQNYSSEVHQGNTGERDSAEANYDDNSSENNDNFDLEDFIHDTYHAGEAQQSSSSQMKKKKQGGSDSAVNSTNAKTVKQSSAHKRQMAGNPNVFNESTIEDKSVNSSKTHVLLGGDEGQGTCDTEMSSEVEQSQGSSSFSESCDDLNVSDDEIQGKTPSECVGDNNVCTVCSSHFTSHETALVHVKLNHFAMSKSHKCRLCEKQFSNRKSVLAHVKYVHFGEKNYVCEHCHKGFKQQHKLTLHIRSHTGEKPYVCNICSASFARKDKLRYHVRRHTGERPHRCDICGKCFVTWSNLHQHLDVHSATKDYKCVACSLSFTSRDALYNHQKTHKESSKEYMCDHCDKGFSSRTAFVHHMKLHSNSGAHYCDVCGKVFAHEASLINHKLTHLSEQNFECKVCSAVFTDEDGLREHQLTHKDGKSAICSFCDETFDNMKEYSKHKCQQAIPSTVFLCSQCKGIFRTEDLIKQHFANIHNKEYVGVATVKITI